MVLSMDIIGFASTLERWCTQGLKRHRNHILPVAVLTFIIAVIWAVGQLDLKWSQLRPFPLLLLFMVLSPLSIFYGAQGLVLLARVANTHISFAEALRASAIGQLAEILPLPGGAMVRTAALMKAGVGIIRSTALVTLTALLWIALAAAGAGWAVADVNTKAAWSLGGGGFLGTILVLYWIAREGGICLMAGTLLHRLTGLLLMAIRLSVAFAILGHVIALDKTLPFVLAAIAGSAASIAPAGLGISELLAALMAAGLSTSPAAALLAVGLNRIIGLVSTAVIVLLMHRVCRFGGRRSIIS